MVSGQSRFVSRRRQAAAFTLVELLVVCALIALLAAILFPLAALALGAAREKACAANLRTWGQLFHLYAIDHKGNFPHPDDRGRNPSPGAYDERFPEHEQGYVDVLPPYIGEKPWRDYPPGQKPTGGIWQCPAASPLPDSAYSYRPSADGYHSYAMNSYLAHDFPFGLPWDAEPQPSFLNLSRCRAPGTTILMFEQTLDPTQGYGQSGGLREAGRFCAEDARALTERHRRFGAGLGGNVLMIDGHVEWRNDLWDKKLRNPRIPKRGDLTWFPYEY